jgi:hypothetical protein
MRRLFGVVQQSHCHDCMPVAMLAANFKASQLAGTISWHNRRWPFPQACGYARTSLPVAGYFSDRCMLNEFVVMPAWTRARSGLATVLALACAMTMAGAHAGRPMTVEDAAIADASSCQLESWVQNNRASTEYWALSGCNFSGNLELSLGAAHISGEYGNHPTAILQGKTLFKPLTPDGWGVGLVFGNQFQLGSRFIGDLYANVPVSFSFQDDRYIVHANMGWLHEKAAERHAMTWGLGAETKLTERTTLTTETFGQQRDKPFFQFGVKHWLLVDRLQLDTSYGDRFGRSNAERYVSVGMVFFGGSMR